jgi:hypothetical protein
MEAALGALDDEGRLAAMRKVQEEEMSINEYKVEPVTN